MKTALLVVFCADTALAVLFPVAYAVLVPGWRSTALGRHMMAYTSVVAGLMLLSVLAVTVGLSAPAWVWLVGYVALGVVLAHRIWLLVRVQRQSRV